MPEWKMGKSSSGFTLIEMLVVISIIGMLASMILSSLLWARRRATDTVRMTNARQLRDAILEYYYDTGHYPPQDTPVSGAGGYSQSTDPTFLSALVTKNYISQQLPAGPTAVIDYIYLNNDGNVGGIPQNAVVQRNFSNLDCGVGSGSKAELIWRLETGASTLFPIWSASNYYNIICFK